VGFLDPEQRPLDSRDNRSQTALPAARRCGATMRRRDPVPGQCRDGCAPGSFLIGPNGARWLVASGDSVRLDTGPPTVTRLVRLDGPRGAPGVQRRARCGALWGLREGVVVDCRRRDRRASTGLSANREGTGTVYRLSAQSGAGRQVARIPGAATTQFEQPAAIVGGFVLRR
jgi:hypothetical protein